MFEKPTDRLMAQPDGETSLQLKARLHRKLIQVMNLAEARRVPLQQLHTQCAERVEALLRDERIPLSGPEKQQLIREVMDEVFGYGPLDEFLRDPLVSDILVNGPHKIYLERQGRLEATDATFLDNEHLLRVIRRIADNVGRRIDESTPMLDAHLPDGSRVNAIIPPLALDGPAVSVFDGESWKHHDVESDWASGFRYALRNFIAAIHGDDQPLLTGAQARDVLRFGFALRKSADRRREVYLDELDRSLPGLYAWKRRRQAQRAMRAHLTHSAESEHHS